MKKSNKRLSAVHIIRRAVQIVAFLLMPGLFVSAFYAIKDIFTAVKDNSFSLETHAGSILLLMGVLMVTVFMGRFFCGFLCSFGAMGDLLWFISKKTLKFKFRPDEKVDRFLKLIKYVLLIFIVVFIWGLELISINSLISPWTIFGMYATIGNWPSVSYLLSVGGLLLLLIMVGSLFIERFFCRYICPLGAVFAVTSRLRFFHIRKNREKCGACKICTKNCSMGIPLYKYDKVTSGECINCFECVDVCPRENVKATPVPAVASAVSVVAISGLVYAGTIVSDNVSITEVDTSTVASDVSELLSEITAFNNESGITTTDTVSTGNYADGTYTGSAAGFRGTTTVSVTVENGYISDIEVVSYDDDREYFIRAEASVIEEIIDTQDSEVDTVSGATFSSYGIIDAVAAAISDAKILTSDSSNNEDNTTENTALSPTQGISDTADNNTGSEEDATNQTEPSATSTPTEAATQAPTEAVVTATSTPVPTEAVNSTTPVPTATNAPTATQAPTATNVPTATPIPTVTPTPTPTVSSGLYADGIYTGSGVGFRGTTSVSVTVENGDITDITVISYQDDAPYFRRASNSVLSDIISSQGINVDTVSGATYSSNGIIEAVADALNLSFTNPNSSRRSH